MGYLHILNLYKEPRILLFRECYALEKIHGTSAHMGWQGNSLTFFSGGEKHERFVSLFDPEALKSAFLTLGHPALTVYGEAYGGSQQRQSHRYGSKLRFVAFDVQVGEAWLTVPQAAEVVHKLGIDFVHYAKVSTDLQDLDRERDAPSEQARKNGIEGNPPREGIVLRPLLEMVCGGERLIAKHKRDEERETRTPRKVFDPSHLVVLTKATEIADEWVTLTRLAHVLDKLGSEVANAGLERVRGVIAAMIEDILREGKGEIVDSRETRAAVAKKTVEVFKVYLQSRLHAGGV